MKLYAGGITVRILVLIRMIFIVLFPVITQSNPPAPSPSPSSVLSYLLSPFQQDTMTLKACMEWLKWICDMYRKTYSLEIKEWWLAYKNCVIEIEDFCKQTYL